MLDVYRTYYKLSGEPFRLGPDHRFALGHRSYANAKAYLDYAIQQGEGFIAITGGPGTGKTTLIAEILAGLDKEHLHVATLTSTQLESRDLLHMVASSFGIQTSDASKANLLLEIEQFLNREIRQGRRAILIVDEAQGLSNSALEELRLLANMQREYQLLLQVFLVGQEQLLELIRAPGMEHLHQRLIATSSLEPLDLAETVDYVEHRLRKVAWQGDPSISEDALRLIHKFSGGVPRRINLICNRLFLYGGMEGKHDLSGEHARTVIKDLQAEFLLEARSIDDAIADVNTADSGNDAGIAAGSLSLPRPGPVAEREEPSPTDRSPEDPGQEKEDEKRVKVKSVQRPEPENVRREVDRVDEPVQKAVDRQAMPDLDPDLTVKFKGRDVRPAVTRAEKTAQPGADSRKQKGKGRAWGKLAGVFLVIGGGVFFAYYTDQLGLESLNGKIIAVTSNQMPGDEPLHAGVAKAVDPPEDIAQTSDSLPTGERYEASSPAQEDSTGLNSDDAMDTVASLEEANPDGIAESGKAAPVPSLPGRTDSKDSGLIVRQPEKTGTPVSIEESSTSVAGGQTLTTSAEEFSRAVVSATDASGKKRKNAGQEAITKASVPAKALNIAPEQASGAGDSASSDEAAVAKTVATDTSSSVSRAPVAKHVENKAAGGQDEKAEPTRQQLKSAPVPARISKSVDSGNKQGSVVTKAAPKVSQPVSLALAATSTVGKDTNRGESSETIKKNETSVPAPVQQERAQPVASSASSGSAVANAEAIQAQYQKLRREAEQRFAQQQGHKTTEPVKKVPVVVPKPATVKKKPAPVQLAKATPQEKKQVTSKRDQIRMTLLQGRWSSREKPASLLPSEVTVCNSEGGTIICQSIPQDINTRYGLAVYKVKTKLQGFSDQGTFQVQYRTLVKLLGAEASERAKAEAESSDEGWRVTEYAMSCRLIQPNKVSCRDNKGVIREYQRSGSGT